MKRSTLARGGLRLSVAETGEGRAMVFQHGLCGDAAQPADVFPQGAGWRCVTLECRGHGLSDVGALDDFALATFADDVASLIEARALAPVVVGGISMGAAIALRLAVKRPDLVAKLVLARPAWFDEAAPLNMLPNQCVGDLMTLFSPHRAQLMFEGSDLADELKRDAPANYETLSGLIYGRSYAVTGQLLARISVDGPGVTRAQIAAINVPTLVIGHGRDLIHPLAMARSLAAAIPGARFAEIAPKADDAGRHAQEFRAALAGFLEELP